MLIVEHSWENNIFITGDNWESSICFMGAHKATAKSTNKCKSNVKQQNIHKKGKQTKQKLQPAAKTTNNTSMYKEKHNTTFA